MSLCSMSQGDRDGVALVAPKLLRQGDYITDGKRLLWIERITTVGVDAEDARDPDGGLVSLPRTIVERDWKKVVRERAKVAI